MSKYSSPLAVTQYTIAASQCPGKNRKLYWSIVDVLEWRGQSPVLNTVQNLWQNLKIAVAVMQRRQILQKPEYYTWLALINQL